MDNNALISCIIPMYNAEKYIENCLESVLSQTYEHFEIIVIDDCSVDQSYSIVKKILEKDSRINLYRNTSNSGVSITRNRGLEYAKGELISYLDADDMLPEDSFEILLNDLIQHNADISFGRDTLCNTSGKEIKRNYSNSIKVYNGEEALVEYLKDAPNTYNVVGKLFKKEIINDIEFEVGRKIGEDSYFFFRCCLKKPNVTYRDYCIYKVVLNKNSATRSSFTEDKIKDILYFANKKLEDIENYYPFYRDLACNRVIRAYISILNNIILQAKYKELKPYYNETVNYIRENKEYYIPNGYSLERLFKAVVQHRIWVYRIEMRMRKVLRKFKQLLMHIRTKCKP